MRLLREWGWLEEETIVGVGDLGFLEHLIHETSHAADLDLLPLHKHSDADISKLCEQQRDKGVWYETRAWAIEWMVWRALDIDTFQWGDLNEGAEIQGVDPDEVKKLLTRNKKDIEAVSLRVIEELKRLCNIKEVIHV